VSDDPSQPPSASRQVPVARTRREPLLRPAAALALLAAAGCAGGASPVAHDGRPRMAATGPAPPGFSADTSTREGLASGALASEAGCRALPDGLWVATRASRRECLRHAAAGAGGWRDGSPSVAVVHIGGDAAGVAYRFAGGAPQLEVAGGGYEVPAGARQAAAEALSSAAGGTPVVMLARPGMHGSSGDHARDRHTRAEVELVDAALTELRRRHGFRGFVLSGFSSGGAVAANLLARRNDIRCAVLASAPLDLAAFYRGPDGALPDHHAMRGGDLADPMRAVGAMRPGAAVVVLGDRRDRKVPAAAWEGWAEAARRAGLRVAAAEVSGSDPAEPAGAASFHQTEASGMAAALACAAAEGGDPDAVAAGLATGRPPPPLPRAVQ
jgi:pimeloyl-ACP methyl ester carboxylesterase